MAKTPRVRRRRTPLIFLYLYPALGQLRLKAIGTHEVASADGDLLHTCTLQHLLDLRRPGDVSSDNKLFINRWRLRLHLVDEEAPDRVGVSINPGLCQPIELLNAFIDLIQRLAEK